MAALNHQIKITALVSLADNSNKCTLRLPAKKDWESKLSYLLTKVETKLNVKDFDLKIEDKVVNITDVNSFAAAVSNNLNNGNINIIVEVVTEGSTSQGAPSDTTLKVLIVDNASPNNKFEYSLGTDKKEKVNWEQSYQELESKIISFFQIKDSKFTLHDNDIEVDDADSLEGAFDDIEDNQYVLSLICKFETLSPKQNNKTNKSVTTKDDEIKVDDLDFDEFDFTLEDWIKFNGFQVFHQPLLDSFGIENGTLDDIRHISANDVNEFIQECIKDPKLQKSMSFLLRNQFKAKFIKLIEQYQNFVSANQNGNNTEPGTVFTMEDEKKDEKEPEDELVIKPDMPMEAGIFVIPTINKDDISGPWKTIMVIGETGSGKSTTLNSMINYLWNVSLEDHYRWVLIPPPDNDEDQAESVTSDVTCYHIVPPKLQYGLTVVDTPGFGDTSGHKTDKVIVSKIEKSFKNDLDTIDAVFFVLKSSQSRLTAMQRYVFNAMLRVFGNDIKDNLFLLITFCDGAEPPVYSSVKKYQLPYSDSFELNNSAFFTGFKEYEEKGVKTINPRKDTLNVQTQQIQKQWKSPKTQISIRTTTKQFWEMGMEAMENLFNKLDDTTAKSLKLSRQVLTLRNHLQLRIEHLHKKITQGLNKIASVRQIIETIKVHAKEVNASQDFTIEVEDIEIYEEQTENNVTTCSNCKYTCHANCVYSNGADKKNCGAMNSSGYCGNCPKNCWWNAHTNEHYFIRQRKIKKQATKKDLKKIFDDSTKGMTTSERIVISQTQEIFDLQEQVNSNIKAVRECIAKLGEIALKPCVMEEDEYYELMIQSEEDQKEPNYKERVKTINELREQARQVRAIQETTTGNEGAMLFSKAIEQLEKDLAEIKVLQGEAPSEAAAVLQRVSARLQSTRSTFIGSGNKNGNNRKKKGGFVNDVINYFS